MSILEKTKENIKKYKLFKKRETLILAVSGGIDSVVLLDVMSKLLVLHSSGEEVRPLIVAHLNHGLRGKDSDLDQKFVKELAKKYELKFETKKIKIKENKNLEEIARKERYKFLAQVAQKYKVKKIITAHQADDQVETILLNYLRGAKALGLSGMNFITEYKASFDCPRGRQNKKYKVIRPFLNIWQREIENYQKKNNLVFRQDKSNFDIKIIRNYLRLKLIPEMEKKNKNFKKEIFQKASELRDLINFLEPKLDEIYKKIQERKLPNAIFLNLSKLNQLGDDLKIEILKKASKFLLGNLKNISQSNIMNILKTVKKEKAGKIIVLPKQLRLLVDYDNLILLKGALLKLKIKKKKLKIGKNEISEAGIAIFLKIKDKARNGFNYDFSKINFPLFARSVLPGDSFSPLGFEGTKKLQDLFVDLKIPKRLRGLIPIISDKNNKILGVLGIRQGQYANIGKNTKKILTIEFKKL